VILVDANILLYAEDQLNPQHEIAREWWDAQLSGVSPVCLCWTVLVRIHPDQHQSSRVRASTDPESSDCPRAELA